MGCNLSFFNLKRFLKFIYSFQLAVIDMSMLSVAFILNDVSCSSSPVVSVTWKEQTNSHSLVNSPKHSETETLINSAKEVMLILTKDTKIKVIDGCNGNVINTRPWSLKKESIAISMYVIGKYCFVY